jgi:hypothetical protein
MINREFNKKTTKQFLIGTALKQKPRGECEAASKFQKRARNRFFECGTYAKRVQLGVSATTVP